MSVSFRKKYFGSLFVSLSPFYNCIVLHIYVVRLIEKYNFCEKFSAFVEISELLSEFFICFAITTFSYFLSSDYRNFAVGQNSPVGQYQIAVVRYSRGFGKIGLFTLDYLDFFA